MIPFQFSDGRSPGGSDIHACVRFGYNHVGSRDGRRSLFPEIKADRVGAKPGGLDVPR